MVHLLKADLLGAGRVIAVDVLPTRLDLAKACGADVALDAAALSPQQLLATVMDLTDGIGVDVVVDCSGHHGTFAQALALARPGGTVIEAGAFVDTGRTEIDPNRDVCVKDVTILGIGGDELGQYAASLRLLARHHERFKPLITHRVGLDEVEDALELAHTGAAMKILVAPNARASDPSDQI
jgi:L-iditol 2-dehydrogenase